MKLVFIIAYKLKNISGDTNPQKLKSRINKLFNALIHRIKVLESTHFVFVSKNGIRTEENIDKIQRI